MSSEILIRLAWTAALLVGGVLVFQIANLLILRRVNRRPVRTYLARQGKPAILYFTTPECVPCKTIQRPALQCIQTVLGERLEIVEINAQERPQLAREWGVLSVPTTFLLDATGTARQVNHGVMSAEKLLEQLKKEKLIN